MAENNGPRDTEAGGHSRRDAHSSPSAGSSSRAAHSRGGNAGRSSHEPGHSAETPHPRGYDRRYPDGKPNFTKRDSEPGGSASHAGDGSRAHSSRTIQAPPAAAPSLKQQGSRVAQVLIVVVALVCLVVPAMGYSTVGTLGNDLASAGNLQLGGQKGDKKDGATDILLVGADSRTDAKGNPLTPEEVEMLRAGDDVETLNTDTIILIRIPNDGSSATAISIPRDSYIHTSDLGNTKINGVYGQEKYLKSEELVNAGETDQQEIDRKSTEAGRQALISAVADLTGIEVDHYAEVGLLGFVLLTDAVGGVEVCLNNAVDDDFSGAHFPAGVQTLNGSDALSFVRQRHGLPRGDLDRIARQQAYMASLANKVLSTGTLTNTSKLSKLSDAVERSVVLDSGWDIMGFATQMQNMAGGHVSFQTIPVTSLDGTGDNGESIVTVDPKQVKKFVKDLVGDKSGEETSETPTTSSEVPHDFTAGNYVVSVMNASQNTGVANRVSSVVTNEGFIAGEVGNEESAQTTKSVLTTANPDDHAAQYLAQKLGIEVKEDSSLAPNTMMVTLTSDYSGPGNTESSLESYLNGGSTDGSDNGDTSASDHSDAPGTVGSTMDSASESPTFTAGDGPKCVN